MYYYDILALLAFLITGAAQVYINVTYSNYLKIRSRSGFTGFEVADRILKEHGIDDVYIVETKGYLSDHFDPSKKVIRLSTNSFHGDSVASLAVAAHEVGHVIQHKEGNTFIKIRSLLVPFVNFSSTVGFIVVLLGFFFGIVKLLLLGVVLLLVILAFELVTLPVEIDASRKALANLQKYQLLDKNEFDGGKTVLRAAALTYVASLASTVLSILRLVLMANRD